MGADTDADVDGAYSRLSCARRSSWNQVPSPASRRIAAVSVFPSIRLCEPLVLVLVPVPVLVLEFVPVLVLVLEFEFVLELGAAPASAPPVGGRGSCSKMPETLRYFEGMAAPVPKNERRAAAFRVTISWLSPVLLAVSART